MCEASFYSPLSGHMTPSFGGKMMDAGYKRCIPATRFDVLEQYPMVMEPDALWLDWNMVPGLYQWFPSISTVTITSKVGHNWVNTYKTHWEPSNAPGKFHRGIALVVWWTLFHDHSSPKERDKPVILLAVAHMPESWNLPSFYRDSSASGYPRC